MPIPTTQRTANALQRMQQILASGRLSDPTWTAADVRLVLRMLTALLMVAFEQLDEDPAGVAEVRAARLLLERIEDALDGR